MFAMKNVDGASTFAARLGQVPGTEGGMTRDDPGCSRGGSSEPTPPWVSAVCLVPHAFPAPPAGGWAPTAKRTSGCVAR